MSSKPTIRPHIQWKCDEAQFYLVQLKKVSAQVFHETRQFGFTWGNREHQGYARIFLFLFSGFLSAFRCVTFYLQETCRRMEPPSQWYNKQTALARENKGLLAAFVLLRDSDVHKRTLHPAAGVTNRIDFATKTASSEFTLNANDLRTLEALKSEEWAVKALTSASVIAISEKVLEELKVVIELGVTERLI